MKEIRLNSLNTDIAYFNDIPEDIFFSVLVHEILHVFGLINTSGSKARDYNIVNYSESSPYYCGENDGTNFYNSNYPNNVYFGANGVNGYKKVLQENGVETNNLENYFPIEDDYGCGTKRVHTEENEVRVLKNSSGVNISYPVFVNEIITGFLNDKNYLTEITTGLLKDIGFIINDNSEYIKNTGIYVVINE